MAPRNAAEEVGTDLGSIEAGEGTSVESAAMALTLNGPEDDAVADTSLEDIPEAVVTGASPLDLGTTSEGESGSVHESGIVHGLVEPELIEVELSEEEGDLDVQHFQALDDGTLQVDVDEFEPSEVALTAGSVAEPRRDTYPSAPRSVPPRRPSERASGRPSGSLPPPRKSRPTGLVPPAASLPPPRDEAGASWLEANHRLAMGREKAKNSALQTQLQNRERELRDVEARLGRALSRVAELERAAMAAETVPEAPTPGVEVEKVMTEPDTPETVKSNVDPGKSEVRASLQEIEGIGPRVEAALRKQGINSLEQLASWSDSDVKRFAKRTKIPRSRIVKGRWVQRAREVLEATSEESLQLTQ